MQQVNWLDKATDWGWGLFTALVVMVFGWVAKWKWQTDRDINDLRLHVSEFYVKKSDLKELKDDIGERFDTLQATQDQIIDLLMQRKIGTNRRQ